MRHVPAYHGHVPHVPRSPAAVTALVLARAAWWAPALFLVLPIALFRQGIGTGTPPFGGDVVVLDYPLLTLIKRQLAHGLLPLWNNLAGGGYPLAPFSALILYPPLWPLRILSVNDQIALLDIIHFALAGLGAYVLAGVTGAGRIGRVIGGMAFVLSGFMIGHLYAGHLFELGVVAWMPWIFYLAHRLIAGPGLRPALLLGLLLGLQILADGLGFLVFTIYPLAILGVIAFVPLVRRHRPAAFRLLGLAGLSILVAAGLAAVLLLPFAQVLGWSIRAGGLDFTGASKISLPPAALLMAFSPDAVGNGPADSYWLDTFTLGYWHEYALYGGIVPLLAAVIAALHCPGRPQVRFYSGLGLAGLVLALGKYTPIYALAFHLPGLNLVRVPARWLVISTLAVSVLAAPGVDWLLAQRAGARALLRALRRPLLVGGGLIAAILAGIQVIYMRTGATDLRPDLQVTTQPAAVRLLIFGGYLALLLACHADRLIRPGATAALLLAFTALDLWTAASGAVRFVDPSIYYRPTTVSNLLRADNAGYRVLTMSSPERSMLNRQGMVSGDIYDVEDFAPVTLRAPWSVTHPYLGAAKSEISNADARDLISCYDARFAHLLGIGQVTTGLPFTSARQCPIVGVRPPILRLQAVVATESWLLPNGRSWNPTPAWGNVYVYRNPDALPRAFLLPESAAQPVPSAAEQRQLVMRNSFNGRRTLFYSREPSQAPLGLGYFQDGWARVLRPAPLAIPSSLRPNEARVLTDDGNSLQIAAYPLAPSYLVLDDIYYPGWEVWVDGRQVPIYRADYVLRAVRLAPGPHLLVFTYAPLSYLAGLAISLVSGAIVLVVLAWPWRRRLQAIAGSPASASPAATAAAAASLRPAGNASS